VLFAHSGDFPTIVLLEFFADGSTEPYFTKELEIVDEEVPD
jgi:hypothetical protein